MEKYCFVSQQAETVVRADIGIYVRDVHTKVFCFSYTYTGTKMTVYFRKRKTKD